MNTIIRPGSGILFMKVGTHAQEPLEAIIERKTAEIEQAGYGLWGYGGNTCHPTTMVQPFANAFEKKGEVIHLCMQPMTSSHFAEPLRASEYSINGIDWESIPEPINVLGSRYALVIKSLRKADFDLPLNQTSVAVGRSRGLSGTRYISGRVDKACLEITERPELSNSGTDPKLPIGLIADLAAPYAVYVRRKMS